MKLLIIIALGITIGFMVYTVDLYRNCEGSLVRGIIGFVCIQKGNL